MSDCEELTLINSALDDYDKRLSKLSNQQTQLNQQLQEHPSKSEQESIDIDLVDVKDDIVRTENTLKDLENQRYELTLRIKEIEFEDEPPTDSDDDTKTVPQPPNNTPIVSDDELPDNVSPDHIIDDIFDDINPPVEDKKDDDDEYSEYSSDDDGYSTEEKTMTLRDAQHNINFVLNELGDTLSDAMSRATYKRDGKLTAKAVKRLIIIHNKARTKCETQINNYFDMCLDLSDEYLRQVHEVLYNLRGSLSDFIG